MGKLFEDSTIAVAGSSSNWRGSTFEVKSEIILSAISFTGAGGTTGPIQLWKMTANGGVYTFSQNITPAGSEAYYSSAGNGMVGPYRKLNFSPLTLAPGLYSVVMGHSGTSIYYSTTPSIIENSFYRGVLNASYSASSGPSAGITVSAGTTQSNYGYDIDIEYTTPASNASEVQFNPTSTGRTGSLQSWTVPATGNYRIEVWGARGANNSYYGTTGGYGATMRGTFALTAGHQLSILVGHTGKDTSTSGSGGGGGGASAVYNLTTSTLLILAGGGGGHGDSGNPGGNAALTQEGGTSPSTVGAGWTGFGGAYSGSSGAAGGGGWLSAGSEVSTANYGGQSLTVNGILTNAYGGNGYGSSVYDGGFGGGAGGGGTTGDNGGGGGGYTGGVGGVYLNGGGNGGGSYNVGTDQANDILGTGAGLVRIAYLNSPPVLTSVTPNGAAKDPRQPITISWTYTDPDGDLQTSYSIKYREFGSSDAWTTVTGTTATSHTFAANTFTLGKQYEYQLTISAQGGSVDSLVNNFMAAVDTWKYGAITTPSSQTGTIPGADIYFKDFNATGITGWESNNVFGSYQVATIAQTTTIPAPGGTKSMEVTWPNGNSWVNSAQIMDTFAPGGTYLMAAELYVPSGSPDVALDGLFQPVPGGFIPVTAKNQWVTAVQPLTMSNADDLFFGIKTLTPPTAGQKMYVSNFRIYQLAPTANGEYIVQVRTADAEGFGPWSDSATFTVNAPPNKPTGIQLNPARVGGNINVTWTYSDQENNPQTKYQIQYRKVT